MSRIKPLEQLKAQGTYREDRHGGTITTLSHHADPKDIKVPDKWPKKAKDYLRDIASDLASMKMLYVTDIPTLKRYVFAVYLAEKAEENLQNPIDGTGKLKKPSEWMRIWKDATAQVDKLGSKFGFSPVDKMKIKLPEVEEDGTDQFYELTD